MTQNLRTAMMAVGVVLTMGAAAWAAVPLYDWFCRVTGFGGTPLVAAANGTDARDETILIRFDASRAAGMPWEFRPVVPEVEVRLGADAMAFYEAYNPTDEPVAGTASYNVAPFVAGGYFVKVHCFCFEMQVLQPGERVEMPVSFYVDPAILEDAEARHLPAITLSYTFHRTELPDTVAADAAPGGPDA